MSLGNKLVLSSKCLAVALTLALGLTVYTNSFASEHAHPHWTYEGEEGPEHWGEISREYAACSEGKAQSPIDITGAAAADIPDIAFSYRPTKLNIVNNGHTIQVNYDRGSLIKVNGADYELVQFHFHDPSEHKVEGKSYGMELHLVHKNAQGQLAVVGVLIEEGSKNAAYETIWANLPKKAKEEKSVDATVNADDLLPKGRLYYRYAGSLTTPPCSESVTWLVLKTPVQMSSAQIEAFRGIVERNSRPVQPLNGRKVEADTTSK